MSAHHDIKPCGTWQARRRHKRNNETCETCAASARKPATPEPKKVQELAPCGTYAARKRHRRRKETCTTCGPIPARTRRAPCGTPAARDRHRKHGEKCDACTPPPRQLKPCGTYAAYQRHKKLGEPVCDPCTLARQERDAIERERYHQKNPRKRPTTPDLINEITFLLNAGEGEARILQATGYTGRRESLRALLHKHGHNNLANRVLNPWDLAA